MRNTTKLLLLLFWFEEKYWRCTQYRLWDRVQFTLTYTVTVSCWNGSCDVCRDRKRSLPRFPSPPDCCEKENKRYMSIEIIKPSPILLYRCRGGKNIYRDPLGQMITLKSWRIAFRNCQLLSSHRESIYYTWSVLTEDERVSVWIFRVIDEKTAAIIYSLQDCLTQSKAAS